MMFERYTDRALRALDIAQEEARNLGLVRVGAGHLLLGLIGEDGGGAAVALKSLGADLGEARHAVGRNAFPRGSTPAGPLPFTSRARGVLDQAATEAAALGNPYIATEHLLLALISDSEGTGSDPLVTIGINPGDARAKVLELLRGYEDTEQRPTPPERAETLAFTAAARERLAAASTYDDWHAVGSDLRKALAALDAALKLADEWAATQFPDDEPMTAIQGHIVAEGIETTIRRGPDFREAITRPLTGEGNTGGVPDG